MAAMRRALAVPTILAGVLLLWPARAGAHAFLARADPRVGSTAAGSPAAVTLTFTESIEPTFSRVEVVDGDGKPVETGAAEHPAPDTLRVPLPQLAAGTYTVHWSVVSIDTHATEGSFKFTVSAR